MTRVDIVVSRATPTHPAPPTVPLHLAVWDHLKMTLLLDLRTLAGDVFLRLPRLILQDQDQ